MDDQELRNEFSDLVSRVPQVRVPDVSVIRRRLRRRRAWQASAGALTCACLAVVAVALAGGTTARQPAGAGSRTVPRCQASQLRSSWVGFVKVKGVWAEAPPETTFLGLRNVSRTSCSVKGWPRLVMTNASAVRHLTISDDTTSWVLPTGANSMRLRAVEPTWVVLRPGVTAVSAVTVSLRPMLQGCVIPRWKVAAPVPRARASRVPKGPGMICDSTSVVVSPLYPRRVPITQNYPASARPTPPTPPAS